ncbi:hypothetical protein BHM03_00042242 [Ensete ventricosum]|nr:hypothetical protein BHM03_00042242 [Ensete ventricosum]
MELLELRRGLRPDRRSRWRSHPEQRRSRSSSNSGRSNERERKEGAEKAMRWEWRGSGFAGEPSVGASKEELPLVAPDGSPGSEHKSDFTGASSLALWQTRKEELSSNSGGDAATAGAIGRSEGQREKCAVVDLLSFDSENELIADGVGKVSLLVGADATVVVHKEDGLVQKNTSVEELRKPTH